MKTLLLIPIAACLNACTAGPVATKDGVFMGGSVGTKSKGHYAKYDGPHGKIEWGSTDKDETVIPATYIKGGVIKALSSDALSAHDTTNATTQAIGAQGVQKTQINATKAVDLKKLSPATIKAQEVIAIPTP